MLAKYPEIMIDLDGSPRSIRADAWRVFIYPEDEVGVDFPAKLDAKLNWSELDRLPKLLDIHYAGLDSGIVAYVASRPALRELAWHRHGQSVIDLRKTSLTKIAIDSGMGELMLRLPDSGSARELIVHVYGSQGGLRVKAPDHGEGMDVTLWYHSRSGTPVAIPGLERVKSLKIWHAAKVELAAFTVCTEIEQLSLVDILGPHPAIPDISKISQFAKLRHIKVLECYDFDAEAFPAPSELPLLETVIFDGLRNEDAKKLQRRLKGLPGLSIRGRRTESWIRNNLENPFFAWGGEYGEGIGSKACQIYKTASVSIDKLGASATADEMQAVLKKFVESFNRLETRHDIDTIMAEEIGDAFDKLARRYPKKVTGPTISKWFDEWRDF